LKRPNVTCSQADISINAWFISIKDNQGISSRCVYRHPRCHISMHAGQNVTVSYFRSVFGDHWLSIACFLKLAETTPDRPVVSFSSSGRVFSTQACAKDFCTQWSQRDLRESHSQISGSPFASFPSGASRDAFSHCGSECAVVQFFQCMVQMICGPQSSSQRFSTLDLLLQSGCTRRVPKKS
jgi:hypothetical protein